MAESGSSRRDGRLHSEPIAEVRNDGETVIVRLAGELDLYNAHVVRGKLSELCGLAPPRLVVDLSHVEFIDSTALGVLIECRAKLPNRRGFLLAAPTIDTRRALQVSGLDRHLPVHESLDEALEAPI